MKRVVAVSFFGEPKKAARYWPYFGPVIRAHHNLFSKWVYRIYHDQHIDSHPYGVSLRKMADRGLVELVLIAPKGTPVMIEKAMLWRLLPLWDDDVEHFVIRDVDMLASYRERCAVETWMRSGLAAHSMSDKKGDHDWPAINGMMGFEVVQTRKLLGVGSDCSFDAFLSRAGWSDEIWSSNYRASGNEGADPMYRVSMQTTNNQFFLGTYIWPNVKMHACQHRLSGSMVHPGVTLTHTDTEEFTAKDLGISPAMLRSDSVTPFIGASHLHQPPLDLAAAAMFYKQYGNPEIERMITECEKVP